VGRLATANGVHAPEVGYKSIIDFGRAAKVEYPHTLGEYPTKIFPGTARIFIERFSQPGDVVLDPFCGGGTFAVECKRAGRSSVDFDINPEAVRIAKQKLKALDLTLTAFEAKDSTPVTTHTVSVLDSRSLPLPADAVDAVVTDIPYGSMIRYSHLAEDLSTIESYDSFLEHLEQCFREVGRVTKAGKYCVVFVCDYRIGAARRILPIHSDLTHFMIHKLGWTLFDTYIWRYYRSGGFRPFGRRPFQAMNLHSYILVFYKPKGDEDIARQNRPVRYRPRLVEKQVSTNRKLESTRADE
jgi:DNA modification methylase